MDLKNNNNNRCRCVVCDNLYYAPIVLDKSDDPVDVNRENLCVACNQSIDDCLLEMSYDDLLKELGEETDD